MLLLKLTSRQFAVRKVRALLTVLAVALAVSLVVSTTSGYASLLAGIHHFVDAHLGATDAVIEPAGQGKHELSEKIVSLLRDDGRVRRVIGRLDTRSAFLGPKPYEVSSKHVTLTGIDRNTDDQVDQLPVVAGKWFDDAVGDFAVLDEGTAKKMNAQVGGEIAFPGLHGKLKLKVVGIVHKPSIIQGEILTAYVPLHTLQKWLSPENPAVLSRISIDLQTGQNVDPFVADWEKRLKKIDPDAHIETAQQVQKNLDKNLAGLKMLSMMGGAVSMGAAAFILFSALSMGVLERQRILAMMRAIGLHKRQVGILVLIEGLMLAVAGIIIGVPLGWLWIKLLSLRFPQMFVAGVVVSTGGVILGVVGSLAAALASSFLPAYSAMRVEPLEAMTPLSIPPKAGIPIRPTIIGLCLLAIDPLLLFIPWQNIAAGDTLRAIQLYGHIIVGIPAILVGFFLLAPAFIWVLERILGPALAAALRVRFTLLRQQLTGSLWRSAGTAAAMMVGLAVLVVMQVHGRSLLASWRLPDKFPDIFIYSTSEQMKLSDMSKIAKIPGIKSVMPITVCSPQFGTNIFAIGVGIALVPDATMFFGVDPEKALKMMDLQFTAGDPETATKLLKEGRHIIVTEEFRKIKGLTVGDKIPLKTLHGIVDYTIAGVVYSPGIDVMVSVFDLGKQFQQRTIASVFGTIQDAEKDFGVTGVYVFAANLQPGVGRQAILGHVRNSLGMMGLEAGDVREIKAQLQSTFQNLLLLAGTVAFAAMAVASLGVVNTVMASVRSRLWQFGVLRSIGVTRGMLLRLVVCEILLLGIVGCALGLAAGLEMAISAKKVATIVAGLTIPNVFPWGVIGIGIGAMILITLIAGAAPAIAVALKKPLELLQAGRAAG
ncbi:MAG TPA: FtsX-like permease family protein [Tepidisphaeraceae bacterium]|nr:FtsX-like permease family protein [Tepidisphaeraceae bacterium]